MAVYNAMEINYEEIMIFGKPALFTDLRLDSKTVPDLLYQYEIRHDDECQGIPVEIAKRIIVNHWGTILTCEPIELGTGGYVYIESDDDWYYTDSGRWSLEKFMQKYPPGESLPETVGECKVQDGKIVELKREYYGQGMIYKNWRAYHYQPEEICYVPELSDAAYTANDILKLCNEQKDFADKLFYSLDWQCPETEKEDLFVQGLWDVCEKCGKIIDIDVNTKCPFCGYDAEESK